MPEDLTPEYATYLDRRYCDLKQLVEAMMSYFPYDAIEENYAFTSIICEFDYLADTLGYEDTEAFMERLIANDEGE